MKKMTSLRIELRKASDLIKLKTTVSGVRDNFEEGIYPLFYHSYQPQKSFVAMPPERLEELAKKAGEFELAEQLGEKIQEIKSAKEKIIQQLKEGAKKRLAKKK